MLSHRIPVNVVTARLMTRRYVKALPSATRERELWPRRPLGDRRIRPARADPYGARGGSTYTHAQAESRRSPTPITFVATGRFVYIFPQIGMAVHGAGRQPAAILLYQEHVRGDCGMAHLALDQSCPIWFLGGLIHLLRRRHRGCIYAKMFTELKQRPYTNRPRRVRTRTGSVVVTSDTAHDGLRARDYYEARLRAHGATPAAWTGTRRPRRSCRFRQLGAPVGR